jgi:type I restriction enzyme M protein
VDEIDADKIKSDPRLPFGLPGVNKKEKVSNGNYIWISYFYSYLSDKGRAGFVMSSQASSAGGGEAKVRQKLVETGDVDVMIAIRSNFFYTRTVPCELWFFDRAKRSIPSPPKGERVRMRGPDTVLMIDARNVYRKVTRKIYDFSPEQQQNLQAIVWLYRGETERYLKLVSEYLGNVTIEAQACFEWEDETGQTIQPLPDYAEAIKDLRNILAPFLKNLPPLPPGDDRRDAGGRATHGAVAESRGECVVADSQTRTLKCSGRLSC